MSLIVIAVLFIVELPRLFTVTIPTFLSDSRRWCGDAAGAIALHPSAGPGTFDISFNMKPDGWSMGSAGSET